MFGAMFWEISSDMEGKRYLIKYAWIEKSVTALSVTIGYLFERAPGKILILIVLRIISGYPCSYISTVASTKVPRQWKSLIRSK